MSVLDKTKQLQTDIAACNARINALDTELSTRLDNLGSTADAHDKLIVKHGVDLSQLNTSVKTLTDDQSHIEQRLQTFFNEIEALKKHLGVQ